MSKIIRAKFKCDKADKYPLGDTSLSHQVDVSFSAVYGDGKENKKWSRWTPAGQLRMTISNVDLTDHFVVGKEYFIDIVEAGAEE